MDKRARSELTAALSAAALFAALMNIRLVAELIAKLAELAAPVAVGGVLAMFLNVPVTGFERRLARVFTVKAVPAQKGRPAVPEKAPPAGVTRFAGFILTLLCVALVLLLTLKLLVPEISASLQKVYALIERRLPVWTAYLEGLDIDGVWAEELLRGLDLQGLTRKVTEGMGPFISGAVNTVASAVGAAAFGTIVAVYMVLGKERLKRHADKLLRAYMKPSWAEWTERFCSGFAKAFARFLSSQCGEAVILGTLMAAAFAALRLPYAVLVGLLTAVCAVIPYVGAFVSCAVALFLTALTDPRLIIRAALVYFGVQLVENQFVYPRVVGGSVGLPAFYTLLAALIGGRLFGIMGILFFIPLAAVIYDMVRADANGRLAG